MNWTSKLYELMCLWSGSHRHKHLDSKSLNLDSASYFHRERSEWIELLKLRHLLRENVLFVLRIDTWKLFHTRLQQDHHLFFHRLSKLIRSLIVKHLIQSSQNEDTFYSMKVFTYLSVRRNNVYKIIQTQYIFGFCPRTWYSIVFWFLYSKKIQTCAKQMDVFIKVCLPKWTDAYNAIVNSKRNHVSLTYAGGFEDNEHMKHENSNIQISIRINELLIW